jgi:hypothetical protein
MLSTADPLIAKTKSPAFIDVDSMGLSESALTIFTNPFLILKYMPAAQPSFDPGDLKSVIELQRFILDDATSLRSFIDAECFIDDEYFLIEITA